MSNNTITIKNTLNWCSAFIVQRPSDLVAGVPFEPGLTCANKIMQTILSAPFRWAWNRKEISFSINKATGSDYKQSLPDFGWLEKATYTIPGGNPPVRELQIKQVLASDKKPNPPSDISPVLDDNTGNVTFRLTPPPDLDNIYVVQLSYQKAPILATSTGTTWAPIPDRYAFLYEQGLLAHLQQMYSPQLYMANIELFFRQLVGAAEGLTETEKAIFLEDQLRQIRTQQASIMSGQQGRQARL